MCSKVWSLRISWDRDVSTLLSEICMHGWKRIKQKWTQMLSKWLILIFIQIRMEKRAHKGKKNRAQLLNWYHKFQRKSSDILTQSTQISRAPSNFSNAQRIVKISHFDNWLRCSRWTTRYTYTFYRSVSSIKRKIYQNATNLVINPLFFCLDFHSRMNTRKKKRRYSQFFFCIHFLVEFFFSCHEHRQTYVHTR